MCVSIVVSSRPVFYAFPHPHRIFSLLKTRILQFPIRFENTCKKTVLWICHCLIQFTFLLSFYFILDEVYARGVAKKVITKTKQTCFLWKVIVLQSLKEKSRLANNSMFLSS